MRQSCSLKTLKSWTHNKDQMFQHALFMHPSACFPCPQNTSIFLPFKLSTRAQPERRSAAFQPCLSSGIAGQSANIPGFGCNHLQLKFNETETDTEFFFPFFSRKKIDAQTSIDGLSKCVFSIFFILSVSHKIITSWPKFTHVALEYTHPCARASIFFFCVRTSEHARASHDLLCVEIINSIYRSGFRSETPQTGGRDP